MPVIFLLFIVLLAAFPYLLLFGLLLIPRILPPVRRIARKRYLLVCAAISFAVVLTLTLISGLNPLNFTGEYCGHILRRLYLLSPLIGSAMLGAFIVNVIQLFSDVFHDETRFHFKPRITAIAAVAASVLYVSAVALHCANLEVQVSERFVGVYSQERIESAKRSLMSYGRSQWDFPLYIEVTESGIEAQYLLSGRLGVGSDGFYSK